MPLYSCCADPNLVHKCADEAHSVIFSSALKLFKIFLPQICLKKIGGVICLTR